MSEVRVYETWEEFPAERLSHITCTDAPSGVRLVLVEDYDKLRTERDRLMKKAKEAYMSYPPITPEMGEIGSTLHEMGAFKRNEFDPEFAALHPTQQETDHA